MDARRNHPAFESTEVTSPLPPPAKVPSFTERYPLARVLALTAAAGTALAGLVAALGASVVNIIEATTEAKARRTNAEIEVRLQAIETRVNGDFGLPLETKARQEKDDELAEDLARLRLEFRESRIKKR